MTTSATYQLAADQGVCPQGHPCSISGWLATPDVVYRDCEGGEYHGEPLRDVVLTIPAPTYEQAVAALASCYDEHGRPDAPDPELLPLLAAALAVTEGETE